MARPEGTVLMEKLVALCKRRGFVFPASDIYGGINGFWDYGPLGAQLKNNLRDAWWRDMVECPPIGPDGEPQSTPLWVDGDATTVRFSRTTGRQKYENLQREPRLAISMIDMDNPYRYLEIRARVVHITDDEHDAFSDAIARKYMGRDTYPFHQPGDHRVVVTVEPEHTTQMG